MKTEQRHEYRTDYLIRQADREYWAEELRYMGKRLLRLTRRAVREAMRFTVLMAGTSLFAFVIVPAMELRPERTLVIAEMLVVLAFGVWLGSKIYVEKASKK